MDADNNPSSSGRKGLKTGMHRSQHARKPVVGTVVFNQDQGRMEILPPKSVINSKLPMFQKFRIDLANTPYFNSNSAEDYAVAFGTKGKRETVKTFKDHRRQQYGKLPKSPAQIANMNRIRDIAKQYKGKGRPPQLQNRTVKGNLLRNNYNAAKAQAAAAERRLKNAEKPKKQRQQTQWQKRTYPSAIASQMSRTAQDDDEDGEGIFM
jgi:hypothetical protein